MGETERRKSVTCFYCGTHSGPFEIDHVEPISRGGYDTPDNIVIACRSCNRAKGPRLLLEWAWGVGRLTVVRLMRGERVGQLCYSTAKVAPFARCWLGTDMIEFEQRVADALIAHLSCADPECIDDVRYDIAPRVAAAMNELRAIPGERATQEVYNFATERALAALRRNPGQ